MEHDICVYCEENKEVKIWEKTGEKVCYDCRLDFLDQEFKEEPRISMKSRAPILSGIKVIGDNRIKNNYLKWDNKLEAYKCKKDVLEKIKKMLPEWNKEFEGE